VNPAHSIFTITSTSSATISADAVAAAGWHIALLSWVQGVLCYAEGRGGLRGMQLLCRERGGLLKAWQRL